MTTTIGSGVTLINAGTLSAGVILAGGVVSNTATGTIAAAGGDGVFGLAGAYSTVVNAGVITGPGSGQAIALKGGGSVTNQSGGSIAGGGGIYGGVYLGTGAALTVVNAGSVVAAQTYGIVLYEGGSVTNLRGATVSALDTAIYSGTAGALTVVNDGLIEARLSYFVSGIYARAGGSVTNQADGTINGYNAIGASGAVLSVVNAGVIHGSTSLLGKGVELNAGGSITNQAGGTITGFAAISGGRYGVSSAALTVVNAGSIASNNTRGLALYAGGSITNLSGGTISGQTNAIGSSFRGALTVVNEGRIQAVSGFGVSAGVGGSVTNQAGGIIAGYNAIGGSGGALTVVNAGTIVGSHDAIRFGSGNANRLVIDPGAVFAGTVDGGNPIGAGVVSTLELVSGAGTMSGIGSQFINFVQTTIDAGAYWSLTGTNTLAAGTTLTNAGTLALLDSTLSDTGTVIDNGTIRLDTAALTVNDLIGTGGVVVGSNSSLGVPGSVSSGETIAFAASNGVLTVDPTRFTGVIRDFTAGNVINLTGVNDATSAGIVNGNTLEIERSSHATIDLTLASDGRSTGYVFNVSSGPAVVTANPDPACFLGGTLIRTDRGDVPVELLGAGDRVVTLSGEERPIRWIGFRTMDLTRHPGPHRVQPICVRAHAFADGAPNRDLFLSPEHAVLWNGVLVPIRLLVNGATIQRDTGRRHITYYHVELETHDILLAENLAAESYLETGNRGLFENADDPLLLHPDLTNDQARREAESCAPFVDKPELTEPIWRALAERAEGRGLILPAPPGTTDDPALCLMVDGGHLAPIGVRRGKHTFVLPAGAAEVRLRSRSAMPSDISPWISDDRRLGVLLRGLTLCSGADVVAIPLDHPELWAGWWQPEWHGPTTLRRWTDGDALIPMPEATPGPCLLEVEVAATLAYPLPNAASSQVSIRRSA